MEKEFEKYESLYKKINVYFEEIKQNLDSFTSNVGDGLKQEFTNKFNTEFDLFKSFKNDVSIKSFKIVYLYRLESMEKMLSDIKEARNLGLIFNISFKNIASEIKAEVLTEKELDEYLSKYD